MTLRVVAVESTELFIGPETTPLQVVRVTVAGQSGPAEVHVEGRGVETPHAGVAATTEQETVEVGVSTMDAAPGSVLLPIAVARAGGEEVLADFELVVAEPGWTMHMVSHFHYDPVWWNTQGAYTSEWDALDFPGSPRAAYQLAGFDLVRAHLDLAQRDPEYKFVLAEVDYLKPYWDTKPADRALLRRLIAQGRLEIMGGTYNEPNTNLTSPETTIRNFVHGVGFQRHVLGADPRTAWQLDVFGHDPAFPGLAAQAGLSSSSWARGPFHQWGPMQVRDGVKGDPKRMEFPSEFEWISPSGDGLLTSYMAGHYSAGWSMDSAPSLQAAEDAAYQLFLGLKQVATTRNVLLPVGTDYTPPNKWITAIHYDWNQRYTWPRFVCSLPRDFFAAVRAELGWRRAEPPPQTRDMNPIYTGKDVSYIDTKQAQREAEHTLLDAERFAVFASLLAGARYPDAAFAKAWVQLAFGAHHDGITGSESDQVYLDLLGGWREAYDLAAGARDGALRALSSRVDTTGPGTPVVVWNPLTVDRADLAVVRLGEPLPGARVLDDAGAEQPALVEHGGTTVTFLATDVPSLGWRTYWLVPGAGTNDTPAGSFDTPARSFGWTGVDGVRAANEYYSVAVSPELGGGVVSLVELATLRELIAPDRLGNELAVYEEYSTHPRFGEGPWHLLPKGPVTRSARTPATEVHALRSALGERLVVRGSVGPVRYTQTITLWRGVRRVECSTTVDEFTGSDQLLRLRWPCPVPGALPVSEVGNAVVGRGFGLVDVDSAQHPWTLDNPAHTWFGLSTAARVRSGRNVRALGVAEIVLPPGLADPLARDLAVALARSGVTSTCSSAGGARYGDLDVDSNLPDVRIAVGVPDHNQFTAAVFDGADPAYRAELHRQLWATGQALVWVPADRPLAKVWVPGADLRGARTLPVLVIAGADNELLRAAVESVVDDLADHVIDVPPAPAGVDGVGGGGEPFEARTVALLNRGVPGFAINTAGTLHMSLMRSCTGWPSGVWIDPPKRTTPDGSGFQLQHWTHVFDYALVTGDGDWREAGICGASAAYSRPLVAVPGTAHTGKLPPSGSLLRVEPANAVTLSAFKAAGNPLTRGSAEPADPTAAVALRLVETRGEPVAARVSSPVLRLSDPAMADLLEQRGDPLPQGEPLNIDLGGFGVATVVARPELTVAPTSQGSPAVRDNSTLQAGLGVDGSTLQAGLGVDGSTLQAGLAAPEAEPAQPLYARYWLHNRGPAALGGLPAAVHLDPIMAGVTPTRPASLRLSVASDRTDGELHGVVRFVLPEGWSATPDELPFGLAAGGHLEAAVLITPPAVVPDGPHPVRARLELVGDDLPASWYQPVEDVAVLAVIDDDTIVGAPGQDDALLWWRQQPEPVRVAAGGHARLTVGIATSAHASIAVEARLLSPWGTWDMAGPWSCGAEVPPRGSVELDFEVAAPPWAHPGRWWAMVKVAGAGRVLYSHAVALEVVAGEQTL